MIRKLRLKFVAICMTLVTAVLAAVLLSVFFAFQRNVEDLSQEVLHQVLAESAPGLSRPELGITMNGDRLVMLPYFTVDLWPVDDGFSVYVTGGTYADLEDSEALSEILADCLSQDRDSGTISGYHLRFLHQDNGLFERIAFVDISLELAMLREMMASYLRIALAAFLLLLGVSVLLSRWAIRPVERAWKQQRQFLSDASHELKTPLTVILSNAELLESADLEGRPARWADNIHSEARQMKALVEEMLTLARADNMVRTNLLTEVSLSDIAKDCALAFEPVAFEAGKRLEDQITEDVTVLGDGDKLRRLVAVLLDNAIKYGSGAVTLTLEKTDKLAKLAVSNPGDPIPAEQLDKLFERFYRADDSRGEQSGFGLGLPIAQTIAKEHKGTLKAESTPEKTTFTFTMMLKK